MRRLQTKARAFAVALLMAFAILAAAGNAATSLVGKQAPEWTNDTWLNTEGATLRLKDLKGKVVLIEFWTYG